MGFYKDHDDLVADVVLAKASLLARWVCRENGRVTLVKTTPYEREILREEQAGAIARLAIDKAMKASRPCHRQQPPLPDKELPPPDSV